MIDQGIVVKATTSDGKNDNIKLAQSGPDGSKKISHEQPLGKRKFHPIATGVDVTASRKSVRTTTRQPDRLRYDQPGTPTYK